MASHNVLPGASALDLGSLLLVGAFLLGALARRPARRREIAGWSPNLPPP